MQEPYIGQITYFAGSQYIPKGWAACDGQLLSIAQNPPLFSLIGTQFGGNGTTTFALPDLRGRTPLGAPSTGGSPSQGAVGGSELHTLTISEIPGHAHGLSVNASQAATGNASAPSQGASLGQTVQFNSGTGASSPASIYSGSASPPVQVAPAMIGSAGGGQGHENRQPYTVMTACIALQGLYPSRP